MNHNFFDNAEWKEKGYKLRTFIDKYLTEYSRCLTVGIECIQHY